MIILKQDDFPEPATGYRFRVSYGEVDSFKVAYYGQYPHWFERARGQFIRESGMSYAEVERRGIFLPVRHMEIRYLIPARYDEDLEVRAAINDWGRASVTFVYQIINVDQDEYETSNFGKVICAGSTQHAIINADGRPVAPPKWFLDVLQRRGVLTEE